MTGPDPEIDLEDCVWWERGDSGEVVVVPTPPDFPSWKEIAPEAPNIDAEQPPGQIT